MLITARYELHGTHKGKNVVIKPGKTDHMDDEIALKMIANNFAASAEGGDPVAEQVVKAAKAEKAPKAPRAKKAQAPKEDDGTATPKAENPLD